MRLVAFTPVRPPRGLVFAAFPLVFLLVVVLRDAAFEVGAFFGLALEVLALAVADLPRVDSPRADFAALTRLPVALLLAPRVVALPPAEEVRPLDLVLALRARVALEPADLAVVFLAAELLPADAVDLRCVFPPAAAVDEPREALADPDAFTA